MQPNILTDVKVILTFVITGGTHGKWTSPNLPHKELINKYLDRNQNYYWSKLGDY
ncbi:MAG: hypothetical protein ACFFCM_18660 [Promethearchaeota archaeon]